MYMLYHSTFLMIFQFSFFSFAFIIFVLVMTGTELTFSKVVCMTLYFGFVLKTVLITQGCFNYC